MRQQLTEAYQRGIRQMWVLNVGDIKPAEYLIEDFLNMAWEGEERTDEKDELHRFVEREFGETLADTLTTLLTDHYRLAFDRKPEHMGGTRVEEADKQYWNTFRPIDGWTQADVQNRVADYQRLSDAVEALATQVPSHRRDAYFQLVQYPVQAAAQMNFKFLCPEKADAAIPEFAKGMKATIASPNADDLVKVKQIMLKQADEDSKTNRHWLTVLNRFNRFGVDIENGYKQNVEALTPQAISNFLSKTMVGSGNQIEVIMMP
jgi:hypothetical protein